MLVASSHKFCAHFGCALRSFPSQRRRHGSKFCRMFWVTDSERVIDDHPTRPNPMTMEKIEGKERSDGISE